MGELEEILSVVDREVSSRNDEVIRQALEEIGTISREDEKRFRDLLRERLLRETPLCEAFEADRELRRAQKAFNKLSANSVKYQGQNVIVTTKSGRKCRCPNCGGYEHTQKHWQEVCENLELLEQRASRLTFCGVCHGCISNCDKDYVRNKLEQLKTERAAEYRQEACALIASLL